MKLIPDATTSFFNLFRTPEPAVSWTLLFGFLALVSNRDPLAGFEGVAQRLTYAISALLGFAYPFTSIPIVLIIVVLLAWSIVNDRSRIRAVGGALLIASSSYLLATLISAIGDPSSGTSVVFSSRAPVLTPALVVGTLVAISFLVVCGGDVFRRPEVLIPFTAALIPVVIANQQLVTGIMFSARDWERYTNYPLVTFALLCLIAGFAHRRARAASKKLGPFLRLGTWIAVAYLSVQLVGWQRDVYNAWASTNVEAHATAELLNGLSSRISEYPVVLENAGLVPLVRLLTDDQHRYVLDYTRLFEAPIPGFADGAPADQAGPHRDELFAHAFRLG